MWREDPVEAVRRWRAHRRPDGVVTGALSALEGIGPALRAGLTPADAVRIATAVDRPELLDADGGPRDLRGSPGARALSTALVDGLSRGVPLSDVWQRIAVRADSPDLAFVAAAWHLSESTGAPLAVAVERAAEALRQGRSRQRRVAVAVAGPRATVTVLTMLPLAGPLFGLACGVGPGELYLSTPMATMSLVAGLVLIAAGRLWCRRLVRRAVHP
ncbi:MAG: type II secretion system F family protein [Terracoccus sp.]